MWDKPGTAYTHTGHSYEEQPPSLHSKPLHLAALATLTPSSSLCGFWGKDHGGWYRRSCPYRSSYCCGHQSICWSPLTPAVLSGNLMPGARQLCVVLLLLMQEMRISTTNDNLTNLGKKKKKRKTPLYLGENLCCLCGCCCSHESSEAVILSFVNQQNSLPGQRYLCTFEGLVLQHWWTPEKKVPISKGGKQLEISRQL